jgi:gas vesicle protein
MVKTKYILVGVLMGIIGIVAAVIFFPDEEKEVKKQFSVLSGWVAKSQDEAPFTMLQKIKNIGTLFDVHCELKAPSQSLSGSYAREEISTYAGSARSHFSQLDLKFYDFHIVFPEKGIANVTLTGRLAGKSTTGEQVDETRELDCVLKKIENKWLFSSIEIVEVLKK